MDVSAAELLVNGRKLHFLAADAGRTLRLFSYEQQHPDTWRGKKLPAAVRPSLTCLLRFSLHTPVQCMDNLLIRQLDPTKRRAHAPYGYCAAGS